MIVMDPPRQDTFRGKRILTAHIISTLHGDEGIRLSPVTAVLLNKHTEHE